VPPPDNDQWSWLPSQFPVASLEFKAAAESHAAPS
jgi:hypothetical protein